MRPVTAAFNEAVRTSHDRAARLTILDADLEVVATVSGEAGYLLDGSVSIGSDLRRSLTLSVANPDGLWTPALPGDAFFPNALLRVERGIVVGGQPEYVSLGIFVVDTPRIEVNAAATQLFIQAQDRLKLALKSGFTRPVAFDDGELVAGVIQALAQEAGMGSTLYRLSSSKTLAADRFFEVGDNRVDAMRQLARDYALDVFVDADGILVVQPALDPASLPDPVWSFERGPEAIMLGLTKALSDERLYNHVLVTGEASDLIPVSAEARDLNPDSPAYNPVDGSGPIGDRLYTYSSPMIRSTDQAQDVADALLLEVALVEETISVPHVVHPALEVQDVVTIIEPESRTNDSYLLDSLTVPLGPGSMTSSARKVRSLT